jgi:hypothetical protein
MTIERDGVRIQGSTDGPTNVLLPLQFSHCLVIAKATPQLSWRRHQIVDSQRLMGDCYTMSVAMIDILSVRGPSKTLLQTGETLISRAFRFTDFASFSGRGPPRN